MKRVLLVLFFIGFVSASVDVDGNSVGNEYALFDNIDGFVNLTIDDEYYDEGVFLSIGSDIELGKFLTDNGVDFECFPEDCSMSYEASSGAKEKSVSVSSFDESYVGFVLYGNNVLLDSLSFEIDSDFDQGVRQPLIIEFFESWNWGFSEFSDDFLLKSWGCFDSTNKKVGPLIGNSFYCEMISIGNSAILKVGADVVGSGGDLDMVVYPDSGFGASWECSFNPSVEDGCVISPEMDDMFYEGEYQVCVGAESLTGYSIYEETDNYSCGFAYDAGLGSSVKDYGIFAQGVMYADAGAMGVIDFGGSDVAGANYIISTRYGGDCSEGCILPLEISGVDQNFRIYNVSLVYTDNSEWRSNDLVYNLERSSAKVSFNGTLDLSFLEMTVSESGEYFAEISGEDLFRKNIKLLPAPIVNSISPLNAPAGVPVLFRADVDFDGNESLEYSWDFGDNGSAKTVVPYVVYTYNDLNNYTLSLVVNAGGNLSSKKSFAISVISPEEAVKVGLEERRIYLEKVRKVIESFPRWYGDALLTMLQIPFFDDELDKLERAQNNSFDVEDFRDVAVELYALNIPVVVGGNGFESPFLMSELKDIDIEPVSIISGGVSGATNEDYANSILTWQNDNVEIFMRNKDIFVFYLDGTGANILSAYSFEVNSLSDRESYFVINKPFSDLYFNGDVGARKAGDATVIILNAGEKKSFDFYYKGNDRGSFFVSPKLSSLVIEADIDTDCNFNQICEEANGENPDNCRSDCKPTGKAVFFFIMGFLFFLVAYTILQLWYKKHYEAYLFKDAAQLYNLLMYIANARARDVADNRIAAELRSKGWSSERVNYAIRKSNGKSIGMVEIVPIERVSAWLRNRQVRKNIEMAREAATRAQQQSNGNINKSGMRI